VVLYRVSSRAILIALAAIVSVSVWLDAQAHGGANLGFDLQQTALKASDRWVHGTSMYRGIEYVYPPLYAELVSPLLLLPYTYVSWAAAVVCMAMYLGSLAIVGVRDVRVFFVVAISSPVIIGSQLGNAAAITCLLTALAWRKGWLPVALAVAIKLYSWPLVIWLLLRRSIRDALLAGSVAASLLLASWAVVGFDGLSSFWSVTVKNADAMGQHPANYAIDNRFLAAALTVGLLALCWRTRDDVSAFAFAVAASLVASPIVWSFYFPTLFVCLAIRSPRFGWAWLVPLVMWNHNHWVGWAAAAFLVVWIWANRRSPEPRVEARSSRGTLDSSSLSDRTARRPRLQGKRCDSHNGWT
jgi:hypothetical protein